MSADKKTKGMLDISEKDATKRIALASSMIKMGETAFNALVNGESPKGDVLEIAKVAAVMAAKATPTLIPMCHPLPLNKVGVAFDLDKSHFTVTSKVEVVCLGRTGVEMEALTAASVASLTIYDMMKWADKAMTITETKLLSKTGGKSGDYTRE